MAKGGQQPKDPVTGPMTPQQERFVDEYVVHLNGTRAAIAAGYKADNARAQAVNLLALPFVKVAVQQRFDARKLEYAGRAQMLMDKAFDIAMSDTAKDSDRLKAIELSGKFLGMGFDKSTHIHYHGGEAPTNTITIDATPAEATEAYNNLLN